MNETKPFIFMLFRNLMHIVGSSSSWKKGLFGVLRYVATIIDITVRICCLLLFGNVKKVFDFLKRIYYA
ncbi:hypothetical protein ASL14_21605 [Paenibacillus sp. IHB B 3084]|nr:hypothetical protein ASL14_21605 [Paenibacillus sp. IHB B 3084]